MKNRAERKEKRISSLAVFLLLTLLASLLSSAGVTLAKYVTARQDSGAVVAKPFYFSSDKLDADAPYYQLDSTGGSTVTVTFQLRNYVDQYRCEDSNFSCTYQVASEDGTVIPSTGGSAAENPGTVSFTGGTPDAKEISFPVDSSYFTGGKKVIVTASTAVPYAKTISAEFGFARGQAQLQYSVSQRNDAVVLEIGGAEGPVTVVWPQELIPDRSNPMLQGADATSITFTAESSTRYAFTFLKSDITKNYDADSFQIQEAQNGG